MDIRADELLISADSGLDRPFCCVGDRMQNVGVGVTRGGRLATRFAEHIGSLPYPPVALSYVPGRRRLPFPKVLPGRCELARRSSLWRDGCLPRGTSEVLSTAAAVRASNVSGGQRLGVHARRCPARYGGGRWRARGGDGLTCLPPRRTLGHGMRRKKKNESYRHCWPR